MNPERGIDAVDLVSGESLWRTDRAAKPLLHHEDRLVAQTEPVLGQAVLRIALLNTRQIGADPRFFDVPLPADVHPSIDDGMEFSFSAAASMHEGALVVSWWFRHGRITGPPPGPENHALDRKATGSVRIDVATGQIDAMDEIPAFPEPDLPAALMRREDAQGARGRVFRVGRVFVAIERATHEGRQRVSLKRWDAVTGEALADVTLFEGGLEFRSVSADGRHLLASRRASDGRTWEWAVYSLESGAKVAAPRHDTPGARFFVAGSRLVHETQVTGRMVGGQLVVEPGKLRAVDLETGSEVWSRAIRDTEYRGPLPPSTGR